ncbi:hypothetical protein L2E82_08894 [Cichorium intybus]|uniref:Uncharacterized protein n=1 Tax=Cichorium intybus TaxID=13427 RepID=A0ACB9G864_CICIN|nr:hypothetical protein L2E82_08894 [Cichorium intybus]
MDVRSVVEAVSTEDDDALVYQVKSLCMRCGENGTTRFLLTLIPHFRKPLSVLIVAKGVWILILPVAIHRISSVNLLVNV